MGAGRRRTILKIRRDFVQSGLRLTQFHVKGTLLRLALAGRGMVT